MDLLQVSKSETQTPVLGRKKANLKLVLLFTVVTYKAGYKIQLSVLMNISLHIQ